MNLVGKRACRFIIAPVVAIALVVPVGARPAQAIDFGTIVTVISAVGKLFDTIKGFKSGDKSIQQATAEIVAAVNSSKTAILAHADALAAAPVRACTTAAVIELADIEAFSTDTMQRWAQSVTLCAAEIDSLHRTVVDKAVADQLGFALNVVGPIALLARDRAGLSINALRLSLSDSNAVLQAKLEPACNVITFNQLGTRSVLITRCIPYPGSVEGRTHCLSGSSHCGNAILRQTARRDALAMTSWAAADIALAALATIPATAS